MVIVLSSALRSLSPSSRSIWSSDADRRPRGWRTSRRRVAATVTFSAVGASSGRASYRWKSTRREGFRIHAGSAAQLIAMPVHLGLPVLGIPLVHHGAVVEAQQLRRAGVLTTTTPLPAHPLKISPGSPLEPLGDGLCGDRPELPRRRADAGGQRSDRVDARSQKRGNSGLTRVRAVSLRERPREDFIKIKWPKDGFSATATVQTSPFSSSCSSLCACSTSRAAWALNAWALVEDAIGKAERSLCLPAEARTLFSHAETRSGSARFH